MKKTILLLLIISFAVLSAQTRAIYEYRFRPDSTKVDSLKTEWMYLDITENGSKYYSKKAFDNDSIIAAEVKKQMATGSRNISVSRSGSPSGANFEVEKNYPNYETHFTSVIDNDTYKYLEDRKLDWKISPEKKKIGEWETQKAETNFAGRQWEAWFTTEIPFQDGPYKFHSLPGLIVKIADKTQSHIMELKAIKPLIIKEQEELKIEKDIPFMKKKPLTISRKQYAKQLEQYQKDPVKGMREVLNSGNSKVRVQVDGNLISEPKEVLRELERRAKEDIKNNNNSIELIN
ncbi:MAG: GLPGLI family protein [Cruoricaptor ignavus]|nr:GLPGLI family protein [Cruoricaptor ignavus]